jgi:hypothetical protein
MSQAAAGTRGNGIGVGRENEGKRDKKHNYIDKILVDTIGMPSIDHVRFII